MSKLKPPVKTPVNGETLVSTKPSLESLLRRKDIWRGHSQAFVAQASVDTGYSELNSALLHGGWPQGCLVELGQSHFAGTWFLLGHAVASQVRQHSGLIALLNPPAQPYAVALLKLGIPLEQVLVLTPRNKADFIACFVELARSSACPMLVAWQPSQKLSYTELRKCQLATHEQRGLYILCRHNSALEQSSPAALRLRVSIQAREMLLECVKQKGKLPGARISLPLADSYFSTVSYKNLDEFVDEPLCHQALATPWLQERVVGFHSAGASKPGGVKRGNHLGGNLNSKPGVNKRPTLTTITRR